MFFEALCVASVLHDASSAFARTRQKGAPLHAEQQEQGCTSLRSSVMSASSAMRCITASSDGDCELPVVGRSSPFALPSACPSSPCCCCCCCCVCAAAVSVSLMFAPTRNGVLQKCKRAEVFQVSVCTLSCRRQTKPLSRPLLLHYNSITQATTHGECALGVCVCV